MSKPAPRSATALAPIAAKVPLAQSYPAQLRRGERTISVSLTISWPASAPPTQDDLPSLRRFLEAVREMAGQAHVGVTGAVPLLEDVVTRGFIVDGEQKRAQDGGSVTTQTLRDIERAAVVRALERHGGNRTHASHELGVTVRTIRNMIRRHKLTVPAPSVIMRTMIGS